MACLYCGKEIGPFRILRDKEFCSSAHRKDYRARLGKALGQISIEQPPPAPPSGFIPYQAPEGNNRIPARVWSFAHGEAEIRLQSGCPVSIVPRLGESPSPLDWPDAYPADSPINCATSRAPRRHFEVVAQFPRLGLALESRLPGMAELTAEDPLPAAAQLLEPAAADQTRLTRIADPLPASRPLDTPAGGLFVPASAVCGAAAGLAAQPVEAFLPPAAEPQMASFTIAVVLPQYVPTAAELLFSADLAQPAPSLAAQAVESLLPTPAEPRIVDFPCAALLPDFSLSAAEFAVAANLADPVASPAPQAVESLLPTPAEPQFAGFPSAALLPALSLSAAEFVVAVNLADAVASPAAQAVESFLPSPAEPLAISFSTAISFPQLPPASADWSVAAADAYSDQRHDREGRVAASDPSLAPAVAYPAAVLAAPQLSLAAADWLAATPLAGIAAAPSAQVVEAFLPLAPEPEPLAQPAISAILPNLPLAPVDWIVAADLPDAVASPAAQAVESFLPLPAVPEPVTYPAIQAMLPALQLAPAEWIVTADLLDAVASPAAQAVESFLPLPALPEPVVSPLAVAMLPLQLHAAEWVIEASLAEAAAAPAAQAVESFLAWGVEAKAVAFTPSLRLPALTLAVEAEPIEEFVPPIVVSAPSESWMPSPPPTEVVREVIPALSNVLPLIAAVQAPGVAILTMEQPMIRWTGDWQAPEAAEPVSSYVSPHVHGAVASTSRVILPNLGSLQAQQRIPDGVRADFAEPLEVEPLQIVPPAAARSSEAGGAIWGSVIQLPPLALQQAAGSPSAEFQPAGPPAVEPPVAEAELAAAELQQTPGVQTPALPAQPDFGLPQPGPVHIEFFCQRAVMTPVYRLEWIKRPTVIHAPKFGIRAVWERREQVPVVAKPAPPEPVFKAPAFAEIFTLRDVARRRAYSSNNLSSTGKAIAASLLVGIGLWFGAGSAKILRQLASINTHFPTMTVPVSPGEDSTASGPVASAPHARYVAPQSPSGPIASLRHAIQQRAAVELTDTFRRMEAWGAAAKSLPDGWTRHPDGYVRTGQLALFRPTQSFADYRLEFFGQIEKKSMSWAVRAHDTQNYHAMKFTVLEPGLRPVIAMVHYDVLSGKKGRRVETPLNVMVHNSEPYHVAVDVKGNRVTTSIEGQEVDSYTDDSLKSGGVGFFSDVGESARLYWVKVTRNQDWLGRVCAYLSGGSSTNSADLWRGDIPAPSQPSQPALPATADAALATAETEEFSNVSPQRGRILKYGRTEPCRS